MGRWMTAEQIGERYVVGADRLHSYSMRGCLPCRRGPDGRMLYSEELASAIFRPRGVAMLRAVDRAGSMGAVGQTPLGGDALAAFGMQQEQAAQSSSA